ncbi:hypothetical protein [Streptomyces griseocarneus]|uniref:hypothetical protein n=1 Tax=Streptomyces griseocarneus TaxID=51201 RepID=UPI00167EC73C|nr:hypothetical protein [Streptomyces griseocarneus]MBZ6475025.1 hypothetical protein [Streptomyces griseocarneus]GHG62709.1 hypothetical protein GCM10018779_31640 [Streptomyces griseocarneus]
MADTDGLERAVVTNAADRASARRAPSGEAAESDTSLPRRPGSSDGDVAEEVPRGRSGELPEGQRGGASCEGSSQESLVV